ncbi:MAG: hypothetical protein RJQ01_09605 [Microcella sp.]|uniref:hypothetical protein n=1 Tax=Microcella sp. TaxID=1913979 RepID=UPI0033146308
MAARVALEIVLILLLAIAIAWAVLAIFTAIESGDLLGAVVDGAPRALFGLMGLALGLWAILLLIGSIAHRRRAVGWRILTHLVSLAAAILVTIGVYVLIALQDASAGGWGLLIVAIAAAVGTVLGAAGTIAVLVVELAVLRPRRMAPAPVADSA